MDTSATSRSRARSRSFPGPAISSRSSAAIPEQTTSVPGRRIMSTPSKADSGPTLVPPNIERLVPYTPGKPIEEVERELGIAGAYKLASNENPLGPSPLGLEAAQRALDEMHRYPDGNAAALRSALAARHQVEVDEIVVGNGSAELI